jgi:hypothetical protein
MILRPQLALADGEAPENPTESSTEGRSQDSGPNPPIVLDPLVGTLRAALNDATRMGLIPANPSALVPRPPGNPKHLEGTFATANEKLPGLDSNQDKETQNPPAPPHNSFRDKLFTTPSANRRTAGRTSEGEGALPADPELTALVAAWPSIPPHIKAAIRTLVGAAVT